MSVFVLTGGAGFIGSHLAEALLRDGHRVRIVDDLSTGRMANVPAGAQCLVGDVADASLLRQAFHGADGCFHLAAIANVAQSNEDWSGTHRTNQSGTIAVLEAARDAGRVPVVYASSAAVYGDQGAIRLHEALPPRPLSAYGADKLGSELHARVAWLVHRTPSVGLRFFNVFGPRQEASSPYAGVISKFCRQLQSRQTLTISGDGLQTRDFVFVGDVVDHLQAAMQHLLGGSGTCDILNVCTGRSTSILGLADAIAQLIGIRAQVNFGPARAGDVRASLGNPAAATAKLGVRAAVQLEDGLWELLAAMEHEALTAA